MFGQPKPLGVGFTPGQTLLKPAIGLGPRPGLVSGTAPSAGLASPTAPLYSTSPTNNVVLSTNQPISAPAPQQPVPMQFSQGTIVTRTSTLGATPALRQSMMNTPLQPRVSTPGQPQLLATQPTVLGNQPGGFGLTPPTLNFSAGKTGISAPKLTQAKLLQPDIKTGQVKDDPELAALKDLRKASGLKHIPVNTSLMTFKKAAVDSNLTKDTFISTYEQLLRQSSIEVPDKTTCSQIFGLFDKDKNGVVDMMELVCGISLLCQGSEDEKIAAVFSVFDENGDGFISMDEMFKFLSSVFRVVLTPTVLTTMRNMGVDIQSPEDLASVTSLECFKVADLNKDDKLSLDEFKNWFYAPRNDPSFMFSPVRKVFH